MKSLTSSRLSNFLDDSYLAIGEKSADRNSIINLSRAVFESDENMSEAPVLVVAQKSKADPMDNLQAIIESYRVFREEVSSVEHLPGDQLCLGNFQFQSLQNAQLDNEEIAMIENTESLEELQTEVPVTKRTKQKKKAESPAA